MRVLIAGGGTGGHLFPGVAIAEELRARQSDAAVRFVGTERGIEAKVLPKLGWDLTLIRVSGLKTVGALGAVKGALRIPGALMQSRRLIKEFKPDVVLGVGGYASGPVVLMARLMGIPTAICEQNSIPGLTNKILGRVVRKVFLTFEESKRFFKPKKIELSGNPVRRGLLAAFSSTDAAAHELPRVFVCGGSLGATKVNDIASEALIELAKQQKFTVVHQTGAADVDKISARYKDAGLAAEVHAFIDQMVTQYQAADIVVSRAGATTLAELAIAGKPAVLVPYPFAADNHQELNAREMAEAGAAVMYRQVDLTPAILAQTLGELLADPDRRARMGSAMKALARPGAAATIVDWCAAQR
jgi:UDP-N-acetylglucosamine--N-acetylmuramyl-(pentapeptide) pyrophosphoryl-undecaprenol N-acetylglucosamine transferase